MKRAEGTGGSLRGGVLERNLSSVIVAAHELKSPLVLMRQLALAAQDKTLSDDERQRVLEQLTMVADRGLRLTNDLTRTARLENSLFDVEPVNVRVLCESVMGELTPFFHEHGRTLRLRRRRGAPLVLAHRDLLRRIVCNFTDNALHYGDEHGKVELVITTQAHTKKVRIGVRDFGPALPLAAWRSLRSTSFLPQEIHNRPQSSGLGIYIAGQFAQAMGGSIGAIRHRDGSTFYVELPLSEQLQLL